MKEEKTHTKDTMVNIDTAVEEAVETVSQETDKMMKKARIPKKRKALVVLIMIVVLLLIGFLVYKKMQMTPEQKAARATKMLVKEVKKLIVLPEVEVPAVFDVEDPVVLAGQQAFFAGVIKGDKLLVYPQAGKAVIYSPSRRIILNVGPVTFDKGTAPANTSIPAQAVPEESAKK